MKTLGQIAFEGYDDLYEWSDLAEGQRCSWETAASAVAEECAKAAEAYVEQLNDEGDVPFKCAEAIRAMKKQP